MNLRVVAPWTDLDLWVEREATPWMAKLPRCRSSRRCGPPSTGKAARSTPGNRAPRGPACPICLSRSELIE